MRAYTPSPKGLPPKDVKFPAVKDLNVNSRDWGNKTNAALEASSLYEWYYAVLTGRVVMILNLADSKDAEAVC